MAVQGMGAGPSLGVPDLQSSVRRAAHDDIAFHLGRPDATSVPMQSAQALTGMSGPDLKKNKGNEIRLHFLIFLIFFRTNLESVVIGSGHNPTTGKLQARNHMVVVSLEHFGGPDGPDSPVHLHVVIPHERLLEPGLNEVWLAVRGIEHIAGAFFDRAA